MVKVYKMHLQQVVFLQNYITVLLLEAQSLIMLKFLYPENRIKMILNYTYIVIIEHFEVYKSEPFSTAICK